jgi:arsenate reductase
MTVLFACVKNAGRSQMAAALFNRLADPASARAISAGTAPADAVHPEVITAMAEIGIDLSDARPTRLTDAVARTAAWLITMGCGDKCPFVPGARVEDWAVDDPHGRPAAEVRAIREEIATRVRTLVAQNGWAADDARPDGPPHDGRGTGPTPV